MLGRLRRVRYTWGVSRGDGTFEPSRSFLVTEKDNRQLEDMMRALERERDPEVRDVMARSLRTTLDLFATFEGEFVDEESEGPPAYQRIDPIPAEAA